MNALVEKHVIVTQETIDSFFVVSSKLRCDHARRFEYARSEGSNNTSSSNAQGAYAGGEVGCEEV